MYDKNHIIEARGTRDAYNDETLQIVTIQKRGMCIIDDDVYEFMQTTAYWIKEDEEG